MGSSFCQYLRQPGEIPLRSSRTITPSDRRPHKIQYLKNVLLTPVLQSEGQPVKIELRVCLKTEFLSGNRIVAKSFTTFWLTG